jgi:hypothetical protein
MNAPPKTSSIDGIRMIEAGVPPSRIWTVKTIAREATTPTMVEMSISGSFRCSGSTLGGRVVFIGRLGDGRGLGLHAARLGRSAKRGSGAPSR